MIDIGAGKSATVMAGVSRGVPMAFKAVALPSKSIDPDLYDQHCQAFAHEVQIASYMGAVGVGPQVYDAYIVQEGDPGEWDKGVMVMKQYSFSLHHLILNRHIDTVELMKLIVPLLATMADNNIVCIDLKPQNFVCEGILYDDGSVIVTDLKVIDYGSNFCAPFDNIDPKLVGYAMAAMLRFNTFVLNQVDLLYGVEQMFPDYFESAPLFAPLIASEHVINIMFHYAAHINTTWTHARVIDFIGEYIHATSAGTATDFLRLADQVREDMAPVNSSMA